MSSGLQAENRPRPKNIDEVASQQHAVTVLRNALKTANLPHMLFYGPPGTGKTSTILALARQLYGPELMKSRVLELNASDERGIAVVREKIKSFAKMAVSAPNPCVALFSLRNYPSPPYKIIILDEADSMTQDAQGALRRIMEQYSRTTRFCLVCNYVTRIIEPVASRCSKFRFRPLDLESTEDRLRYIAREEGLVLNDELIPALIRASDGDMRRSITYLQSVARLAAARGGDVRDMSGDAVAELAGIVPHRVIEMLGQSVGVEPASMDVDEDVKPAGTPFDRVSAAVQHVVREGYSCIQVLLQFHDYVIMHPLLNARQKTRAAIQFGQTDKALMDGGNEALQLLSLGLQLHQALARSDYLYELFCVAIASAESAPLRDLVQSTSRLVLNHGGVVRNVQYWGKRTLPQRARRHQQYHTAGDYWLMQFDTNAPTLKVLNDRLRQDPRVVKWNTLKLGEKLRELVPPASSGGATPSQATMGGKSVDYLG